MMSIKKIEKASLIYGALLALIFGLSLYIRALPYDSIFGGPFVRFGGNDPWYNMRLVESTLHNFPHRIYFDALTYYPHGTNVPFAPLFDYLLAVIIWLIGLGNPYATLGEHGIEVIGAWYPAVLGALTVIPVYFIGKELWNRNAGLLSAALIAILPGQFLSRSLLGFTDHHVAETLFSTIAMLFLILAIKHAKKNEITFYSVLKKDWDALRKPMTYSILSGVFLGSYYLAWKGAPILSKLLPATEEALPKSNPYPPQNASALIADSVQSPHQNELIRLIWWEFSISSSIATLSHGILFSRSHEKISFVPLVQAAKTGMYWRAIIPEPPISSAIAMIPKDIRVLIKTNSTTAPHNNTAEYKYGSSQEPISLYVPQSIAP